MSRVQNDAPSELDDDIAGALDNPLSSYYAAMHPEIIEKAIRKLPERQRQAFLLRYWEELDVSEAAAAMGCSEGSVKTHCSRAVHSLSGFLKEKGISL
jgi:RNA polymerase sigma-70 factor (ECF subfamily)